MTRFEKTRLPHTQYQTYVRFHQKWITGSIHYHIPLCALLQSHKYGFCGSFLRPCVSLKWHFGAIRWSWLYCIGAWRAGQATKGWPMSVTFDLECCEHKESPVGPQTGPLAFNYLRIPFCTPVLSPPSIPTHHLFTTTCNIITITKKAAQNSLTFGCLKVIHPHNYS